MLSTKQTAAWLILLSPVAGPCTCVDEPDCTDSPATISPSPIHGLTVAVGDSLLVSLRTLEWCDPGLVERRWEIRDPMVAAIHQLGVPGAFVVGMLPGTTEVSVTYSRSSLPSGETLRARIDVVSR